jgi:hypothetical protein
VSGYRRGASCWTVGRLLRIDPTGHCESCHEDMAEGYQAGEIETRKGAIEVCCVVLRALDERAGDQP